MVSKGVVLGFFTLLTVICTVASLTGNTCTRQRYITISERATRSKSVRDLTNCGLWGWSSCSKYKLVTEYFTRTRRLTQYYTGCCPKWKQIGSVCVPECSIIPHCAHETCQGVFTSGCATCLQQGPNISSSVYWPSGTSRNCSATCSWEQYHCWPGNCSDGFYSGGCTCIAGFTNESGQCHFSESVKPTLATCNIGVVSKDGQIANSTIPAAVPGEKDNVQDNYINFKPKNMSYTFDFDFQITGVPTKPPRIKEFHFGVTSASVTLGTISTALGLFREHSILALPSGMCNKNFTRSSPYSGMISCRQTVPLDNYFLNNGERFCARFEAEGGGYFIPFDALHHRELSPKNYNETSTSKLVCIWYDSVAPIHCSAEKGCFLEPLHVANRITRSGQMSLSFKGWSDPYPSAPDQASGIEHYEIQVFKVENGGNNTLMVKPESTLKNTTASTHMDIELSDQPELYALILTVKDIAGNVQQARRFVLFDNSSQVEINKRNPMLVTSANPNADYMWQVNHRTIQLRWVNHFRNSHHFHHNLLRPIKQNLDINGVYDQVSGDLPVTGILNIHGIVDFQYSFQRLLPLQTPASPFQNVSNFQTQLLNLTEINPKDGESYRIWIKATDIMNNTLVDNVTVHFDSTEPEVSNMWLVKDGQKQLYVHHTTDLSNMTLQFNAKDPESGLFNVKWRLGTERRDSDIGSGYLPVVSYKEGLNNSRYTEKNHYCPAVGRCEFYNYSIGRQSLGTHIGQHNRRYHFTIEVMNNAKLMTTAAVVVHVDESPPVIGTVFDGFSEKDRDFQTDLNLNGHWHGFYDHESGISKYKVAISSRCLTKEQLLKSKPGNETKLTTLTTASFQAQVPGYYVLSVMAFNKAMEPSDVACSDGVTIDDSPPEIYNVLLPNARIRDTIVCDGDAVWLITSNLTKLRLSSNASECIHLCLLSIPVSVFPDKQTNNTSMLNDTESNEVCLETHSNDFVISLPNDAVSLLWEACDKESQLHDFEIGISSNGKNVINPDISGFHTTHNHTYFKRTHSGFGHSSRFFLLIRATNKAGLSRVTSLGPIRLHESPPLFIGKPTLCILDNKVEVVWNRKQLPVLHGDEATVEIAVGTRKEEEAAQQFRLAAGSCSNDTQFCENLEISKLQQYNREFQTDLFVYVRITNVAGLSRVVGSEPFQLPTALKPSIGRVYDVNSNFTQKDIDFILATNTVCAAWNGFEHEGARVNFAVGLGKRTVTSDVLPYDAVSPAKGKTFCITTSGLPLNTKLFFNVQASTSAGSVTASSDGFTIVEAKEFKPLKVFDGARCEMPQEIVKTLPSLRVAAGLTVTLHELPTVQIGSHYTVWVNISISQVNEANLLFPASKVYSVERTVLWSEFAFWQIMAVTILPLTKNISFHIRNSGNEVFSINGYAISNCAFDLDFQVSTSTLSGNWKVENDNPKPSFHFECAVAQEGCSKDKTDCDSVLLLTPFKNVGLLSAYTFTNLSLQDGRRYFFLVRQCFHTECFSKSVSDGVLVSNRAPLGALLRGNASTYQSLSSGNKMAINVEWERFFSNGRYYSIRHYIWTISTYNDHATTDGNWYVKISEDPFVEDHRTIQLQLHDHRQMYVLLRGFAKNGLSTLVSAPIKLPPMATTHFVVELRQKDIKKYKNMLHAPHVGPFRGMIGSLDVDFTDNTNDLGVVVVGSQHSTVSWFVTERPEIPADCAIEPSCHHFSKTRGNIMSLVKVDLAEGFKYYVCALATEEKLVETVPAMKLCSNGFFIDRTPPKAGHVSVLNSINGHLLDPNTVALSWHGFIDKEELENTFDDGIMSYSYAAGSSPNTHDVVNFTDVGASTHVIVTNISLENGMVYYFTVRGNDYVGLSSFATSRGVMVDTTPPDCGAVFVGSPHRHSALIGSPSLQVHWNGMKDDESGVSHVEVAIGSGPHQQDIMAFTPYQSTTAFLDNQALLDGHTYYAQVQVTNGANLRQVCHAPPFLYDSTPPTIGAVRDGPTDDIDYQNRFDLVSVNWGGFIDPHSGIRYYKVAVHEVDQEPDFVLVGNNTEFSMRYHLTPGVKYIATVEACNNVGLCSQATSDGLKADVSPPIAGLVNVGFEGSHSHYLAERSSMSIRWFGFHDAESGIRRYSWCLGTEPKLCDIVNMTNAYTASSAIVNGLQLPESKHLYATVTAKNGIGLTVNQSSRFVIVDTTPPEVRIRPQIDLLEHQVSLRNGTQFDPSQLRCTWKFVDDSSPVISHLISISTHHDGIVPIPPVELGNVDHVHLTMPQNQTLSDGDVYTVTVTACNAAGLCTPSTSDPVLVDSSPPHFGGFQEPLSWSKTDNISTVNLSWAGFADAHSGIDAYFVTLGTNDSDVSGWTAQSALVPGDIHNVSITTFLKIFPGQLLFLSLWAENGVGLRSHFGRVSVKVVSSSEKHTFGILDIEKHSCDVHYCNLDCTCAVIGQKCIADKEIPQCFSDDRYPDVKTNNLVFDGTVADAAFTSSSKCLSGHWFQTQNSDDIIKRYEWSIGFYNSTYGDGIFDVTEQPWFDIGHLTNFTYCLPGGRFLEHKQKYAVYLRAWTGFNTYFEHMSNGVIVDLTPPSQRKGKHVKDCGSSCDVDIDFSQNAHTLSADWEDVFTDTQSPIDRYDIFIGTFYGGNDVLDVSDAGLATNFTASGLNLEAGVRYYTTIVAYNKAGLSVSATSDGVTFDSEKPKAGKIYSTAFFHSKPSQHSTETVGISWTGFDDFDSNIAYYEVTIGSSPGLADILPFKEVGLNNVLELTGLNLTHASNLWASVRGVDAAGIASEWVHSDKLFIDTTPPTDHMCSTFDPVSVSEIISWNHAPNNVSAHPKDQNLASVIPLSLPEYLFGDNTVLHVVVYPNGRQTGILLTCEGIQEPFDCEYNSVNLSCTVSVYTAMKPTSSVCQIERYGFPIKLHGAIAWVCNGGRDSTKPVLKQLGLTSIEITHRINDPDSGIKRHMIGLGTTKGGFQLQPLFDTGKATRVVVDVVAVHGTPVYATVISENNALATAAFFSDVIIVDWTPPAVHSVRVSVLETSSETSTFQVVAKWEVFDNETAVSGCTWAIGRSENSADLGSWQATATTSHAGPVSVTLSHGEEVHVTIQCTNEVDLVTTVNAKSVGVVTKPPVSENASISFTVTKDSPYRAFGSYQSINSTLHISWSRFQDESGIKRYLARVKGLENQTVVDWTDCGFHTDLLLNGLYLEDGQYSAEIIAENSAGKVSSPKDASVFILATAPSVTGVQPSVACQKHKCEIDWQNTFGSFQSHFPLRFEVSFGSKKGACNILPPTETLEKSLAISNVPDILNIFGSITAISPSGTYTTVHVTL